MTLKQKTKKIKSLIQEMDSALVAFSGGVDSTLVLALAHEVLGEKVVGVTAQSPSIPNRELQASRQLAKEIGSKHLIIKTAEMSNPEYQSNPANRCYHCKTELYSSLKKFAKRKKISHILNGINSDDLGDYRPGLDSSREQGIRSPLVEANFNKQDVRNLSRIMGLSIWSKPAMACLSSRIPYGQPITSEKLTRVEQAEDFLLSLGFKQVRVRHLGTEACIELDKDEIPRYQNDKSIRSSVQKKLMILGFSSVLLDPEGYKMGNLNKALFEQKDHV